jgi:hypothetical protein
MPVIDGPDSLDIVNVSDWEEENSYPTSAITAQSQEVGSSHFTYHADKFDDEGAMSDPEAAVCTRRDFQEQIWTSRTGRVDQADAKVAPLAEAGLINPPVDVDIINDMVHHFRTTASVSSLMDGSVQGVVSPVHGSSENEECVGSMVRVIGIKDSCASLTQVLGCRRRRS